MKVIQETQDQLTLKQGNIGNIIFGTFFAAAGIGANLIAKTNIIVARIIGLIFVLCGAFMVLFSKSVKIIISRLSRKITIEYAGILGKKAQDLKFDEIKEVAIEEYVAQTGSSNPRSQLNYNLVFYKKDGEGILISLGLSGGGLIIMGIPINMFSGRNRCIELGNKIATFIGVPFVDRRPPTVTDVISTIQTTIKSQQPMSQTPQSAQTPESIVNKS